MSSPYRLLGQRWPWLTVAGLVIVVYLSTLVDFAWVPKDERPTGTAADIEALRGEGLASVTAARLAPDDVGEDIAEEYNQVTDATEDVPDDPFSGEDVDYDVSENNPNNE